MPPIDNITKDFLRDVFKEEKFLFRVHEIKPIVVPHYEEISVKAVFETYKNDEALLRYLPEIKAKGKQLDRTFFYNVLNTIYPEVMPAIVASSREQREKRMSHGENRESIDVASNWAEQLKSIPFHSSK